MSPKTTPMHASASTQVRAAPAWATVPIFAVTFIKSDPSLPIRAYCRHEQLRSEAQPNFGKLFSASLGPPRRLDPDNVSKWIDAGRRPTSAMGEKLTSQHHWPGRLPKH